MGCHTCWLNYFTLVCLWCGRTVGWAVGRCTVTWLPNFLGWVVYHISLPTVLRCARLARESSATISAIYFGHVETQTMQTADCRLQTVQTECYIFYLHLNFRLKFLLQFPASSHYVHCASLSYVHRCVLARVMAQLRCFHAGARTMEEGKLFLSVTVLYCHDYLNFFSRRRRSSTIKETEEMSLP